eukprot:4395797-Amphidinium_carterae.2
MVLGLVVQAKPGWPGVVLPCGGPLASVGEEAGVPAIYLLRTIIGLMPGVGCMLFPHAEPNDLLIFKPIE